jgi:hypothetical protein
VLSGWQQPESVAGAEGIVFIKPKFYEKIRLRDEKENPC